MKQTNIEIVETLDKYSRINIRGIELLVSNIDIPRITQYRWYPDINKIERDNLFYVKTRIFYNGKYKYISMHRFILEAWEFDGVHVVDHINQDSKDNRLENLRFTDMSTNIRNSRKNKEKNVKSSYLHYSTIERGNAVLPMQVTRISIQSLENKRETIVKIDGKIYRLLVNESVGFSSRNKFGYPGLSYDKQHKKILVTKDKNKLGFYSTIEEALKRAHEAYKIPYTIQITQKTVDIF